MQYSQLAIRNEQICLSSGYNLRFIGHASVSEILILYSTEPYGNIRIYTFGMMILWKWPSFSFEKNKSGIHTRFASVNVRYFSRPTEEIIKHNQYMCMYLYVWYWGNWMNSGIKGMAFLMTQSQWLKVYNFGIPKTTQKLNFFHFLEIT